MATRNRYGFDRNNRLMDITGPDGEDNTILVTARRPIMQGVTIDRGIMDTPSETGQFREYEAWQPRPVGSMPGGERTVVAGSRGKWLMRGADQRLMDTGFGGMQVNDGKFRATDSDGNRQDVSLMEKEGYSPIMSRDGRLALSPQAVGAMGERQLIEEQSLMRGPVSVGQMGQRLSVRKQLQAQADQGFVKPGTDARNLEAMDATIARGDETWLRRNRPRAMMERGNTASQIMTQADASLMTPQVMTQDGVMAGWDPISKKIVSDASGAQAIAGARIEEAKIQAAGRTKDVSLQGEDDKTLMDEYSKRLLRKSGKLPADEALFYNNLMKTDPKRAEGYKRALVGEWGPEDDQINEQYQSELIRRGKLTKAPAAGQAKKTLGGIQAR